MKEFENIIDTNVKFNFIEDYYWHVFMSLYKNGVIKSSKYNSFSSYEPYQPSFKLNEPFTSSPSLSWVLDDNDFNKKLFSAFNSQYKYGLFNNNPPKNFSGYKFFNDDFNSTIDAALKNICLPKRSSFLCVLPISERTFPLEFLQTITILCFYKQEHFVKTFFKDHNKNSFSVYDSKDTIKKLVNLYNLFDEKDNFFFSYLLKHKFIKNLTINTKTISIDDRIQPLLNFINTLSPKYQDQFYEYLLKKSTEKEKLCLKQIIKLPEFSERHIKKYQQELANFSVDNSVETLNNPKELLKNERIVRTKTFCSQHFLEMDKLFEFYKKLYLKKNFPITSNNFVKIETDIFNYSILISIDLKEDKKTLEFYYRNRFPIENEEEANRFNKLFDDNFIYFLDMLIIKSHKILVEKNKSYLALNNTELKQDFIQFTQELREKMLNEQIESKDIENIETTVLKKKI